MLQYSDLEQRMRQWDGLYGDPEWLEIRAKTNGPEDMVERFDIYFMRPGHGLSFDMRLTEHAGIDELCLVDVPLAAKLGVDAFVRNTYVPLVERFKGKAIVTADLISGPSLPKIAILTRWTDANAWREFRRAALAELNPAPTDAPKVWREEVHLLAPF
jgi:hypothetical protein